MYIVSPSHVYVMCMSLYAYSSRKKFRRYLFSVDGICAKDTSLKAWAFLQDRVREKAKVLLRVRVLEEIPAYTPHNILREFYQLYFFGYQMPPYV